MDAKTKQIFLGSLYGDGAIRLDGKCKNPFFFETHCVAQKDYLIWKTTFLKKLFKKTSFSHSTDKDGRRYLRFRGGASEFLHPFLQKFYPKHPIHKKITPSYYLNQLGWLGMAIWYVDDGSYSYYSGNVYLHFSKFEKQPILDFFTKKGLMPSFCNDKFVYFNKKDSLKFINKIRPYVLQMPKCVHYKIGLDYNKKILFSKQLKIMSKKSCKKYQEKYPERIRETHRKSYYKHQIKNLKYAKDYRDAHKSQIKAYMLQWRAKNKEHIREYKRQARLKAKMQG